MTHAGERSASPATACPRCRSDDTIPIVYGYPGPELMEAMERGEIMLGGCCIEDHQPLWHCRKCRHEFPSLDASDWYFPARGEDWTDADHEAWERADLAEEISNERLAEVIAEARAAGLDETDAILEAFQPERWNAYLREALHRRRDQQP